MTDREITQVTRFATADGLEFPTRTQAEAHTAKLALRDWYERDGNRLWSGEGSDRVDWDDLVDWLTTNREQVRAILKL